MQEKIGAGDQDKNLRIVNTFEIANDSGDSAALCLVKSRSDGELVIVRRSRDVKVAGAREEYADGVPARCCEEEDGATPRRERRV